MTELFFEAFATISQLPKTKQNTIANPVLEQLFKKLEYFDELKYKKRSNKLS